MTDKQKKIAIIAGIVAAVILVVVVVMSLMGGEEGYEGQVSSTGEYTPPPLSDNPPMSGSDIDAITQEIRDRRQNDQAPTQAPEQ